MPTMLPTKRPSFTPTSLPTSTKKPTTMYPTLAPTSLPTRFPTKTKTPTSAWPTKAPVTASPTTAFPTKKPITAFPTKATHHPTFATTSPTLLPTIHPTKAPSLFSQKLSAPIVDGTSSTQGVSVKMRGDFCLVGGSWDNLKQGAAWIFTPQGEVVQKLTSPSLSEIPPELGTSVSMNENFLVALGAPNENDKTGKVVLFAHDNNVWTEIQSLTTELVYAQSLFGYSLALSQDRLLVGAPGQNFARGTSFVFVWNGTQFVYEAQLTANDGVWFSQQGFSVDLNQNGDVAVVGGPGDQVYIGATWVYTRNPVSHLWVQAQPKVVAVSMVNGQPRQGFSVSYANNRILVGGPTNGGGTGGAWILNKVNGVFVESSFLYSSQTEFLPQLGYAVSLNSNGDLAAVGAPKHQQSGAIFQFSLKNNVWVEGKVLISFNAIGNPQQGFSVFVEDDDHVLSGGPYDSNLKGAAWLFDLA